MLYAADQGSGEVVVLLHGFCGSSKYWDKVIPALSQKYRVIAPDMPGHGNSTDPEQWLQIEDYAQLILELLNEKEIEKANIFGHSMGGYITLAFAEKYPERLKSFGLIHSTPLPDDEQGKKGRDNSINKIQDEGIDAFIEGLIPKLFAQDRLSELQQEVEEAKRIGRQTSPTGAITALYAMKHRPDRSDVLKNSTLQVLLVAGAKDQLIPPDKLFVHKQNNIKEMLIEQAGHMSMYETPETLVQEIETFLSKALER